MISKNASLLQFCWNFSSLYYNFWTFGINDLRLQSIFVLPENKHENGELLMLPSIFFIRYSNVAGPILKYSENYLVSPEILEIAFKNPLSFRLENKWLTSSVFSPFINNNCINGLWRKWNSSHSSIFAGRQKHTDYRNNTKRTQCTYIFVLISMNGNRSLILKVNRVYEWS